jgi:tRNA dimethylallyltransferase
MSKPVLIVICGPTASGKTAAAIKLAEHYCTEVISADSRQFYREMRIGTARPEESELKGVPHHFLGHLSIHEEYNIARYEMDVLKCLDQIFSSREVAIMAGGSGLYIDAVCKGVDALPAPSPEMRQQLQLRLRSGGISSLQDQLKILDPEYYRVVDPKNPARLIRALEVCLASGLPYSSFRKGKAKERPFDIIKLGMELSREELYNRISHRVDRMMDAGLADEVRSLLPYRHLNALNTFGYQELFGYFDGLTELHEAVEKIKMNTRRYAKRQLTWFRRDKEIRWVKDNPMISLNI